MRKSAVLLAAAGLATATLITTPSAEARPWGGGWGGHRIGGWGGGWGGRRVGWGGGWGGYRGWGYRGGWGWGGGGALAAGLIGGLALGSLATAAASPYYYDGYDYPYGGYGYAPVTYGYGYDPVAYSYPAYGYPRRVVYARPAYRTRVIVRRASGPRLAVYRPRAGFYGPVGYRRTVVYRGYPGIRRAARVHRARLY